MLTQARRDKIEEIRAAIAAMLAFRDREVRDPLFLPSDFWKFTNRYTSYVRELSADELANIRCHVGMGFFIGNPWATEFYDGFRVSNDHEAEALPLIQRYRKYTDGLPEKFLASEYETTDLVARVGVRYRGRVINADVLKEQAAIANMYNLGLLEALDRKALVAEIGPGYGQLVAQLVRGCGSDCRFVLVDYPETLFWSATFTTLHAEPEEIYIWNASDDGRRKVSERCRYFFIPNFALEWLRKLGPIDLAINGNSFQEMTEQQVASYAKFLSETTRGWLYSYNANRQFMNTQISESVVSILREHFSGGPEDDALVAAGFELGNPDAKRLFVGYGRGSSRPQRTARAGHSVWITDKPFDCTRV